MIFVWLQDATDGSTQHSGGVVSSAAAAAAVASLLSGGGVCDQLGGGSQMFQCIYCGSTFPHQSKLTRHILSHSLDSLKYRENTHYLHFGHELTGGGVAVGGQSSGGSGGVPASQPYVLDGVVGSAADGTAPTVIEIEFAAAAAAAAAAAVSMGGLGGLGGSGMGGSGMGGMGGSGLGRNSMSPNSAAGDTGNVVLCKFCGKSFPDVSSLITHLPVHTGDRPFKCEFCGKAFKLRHHMKDHCRVHTGEYERNPYAQPDMF